jgi:Arc/MetJ-type ribon-helix-helix transcriptional regulator
MNTEPTTLALPSDLLAAVDKVVQEGGARSRDELVESALRRQLAELRRSALDAEFRHMADDADYQRDVHQILGEFAQADWETSTRNRILAPTTGDYEAGRGL